MYYYFPDDTTSAVLFREMVSIIIEVLSKSLEPF
jgi:hypothetical protein